MSRVKRKKRKKLYWEKTSLMLHRKPVLLNSVSAVVFAVHDGGYCGGKHGGELGIVGDSRCRRAYRLGKRPRRRRVWLQRQKLGRRSAPCAGFAAAC